MLSKDTNIAKLYKIIEEEVNRIFNTKETLICRDEIATALLNNPTSRKIVESTIKTSNNNEETIWKKAANFVDWLNADITKKESRSSQWNNYYIRQRMKSKSPYSGKNRMIWWIAPQGREKYVIPEEVEDLNSRTFPEGTIRQINVNAYERNKEARKSCLMSSGYKCQVCGFDFKKAYGYIGEDYIHVHHIKPLSEVKLGYKVNPLKDLVPVCPNCHAMLHRKSPPFTISELKDLIENKE